MDQVTGNLLEKICTRHDNQMEVYCRTDQQCVCRLCTMGEHRGHDTVSAAAERTERQKLLGATLSKFQDRIQERKKELQDLRQAVQSFKRSARTAVEDSEWIFTEMIHSIQRRRSEVKALIRDQEKAEVSQAERVMKRLEQEIAELKKKAAELEKLSHTADHTQFRQRYQSPCAPPGPGDVPSITVSPRNSFQALKAPVSDLKDRLEDVLMVELIKLSGKVKEVHILEPRTREDFLLVKEVHILEPRTREDFLQHSCRLTLDPNTAHRRLRLSEGNREVTRVWDPLPYPDHPERFDCRLQVLCREGLSGHCYWEAEWSGGNGAGVAVSYKEISRKGGGVDSCLGFNDKSWSLYCTPQRYCFWFGNECTDIPAPSSSSRVGVYLDHRAGTLSFYSVSDTMTLLHRVQTTFTQPLYPAFRVYYGSSAKLCD